MKREFVPLTQELATRFYGRALDRTVRGYAYLEDGEPAVIWGLKREPYRWVLFSEPEKMPRTTFGARRAVVLGIRKLEEMLARVRGPVHAFADDRFEGACALLERLGFKQITKEVYEWVSTPNSSRPR